VRGFDVPNRQEALDFHTIPHKGRSFATTQWEKGRLSILHRFGDAITSGRNNSAWSICRLSNRPANFTSGTGLAIMCCGETLVCVDLKPVSASGTSNWLQPPGWGTWLSPLSPPAYSFLCDITVDGKAVRPWAHGRSKQGFLYVIRSA